MSNKAPVMDPSAVNPQCVPAPQPTGCERRLSPIFPRDFGEQVVGSGHKFTLSSAVNMSGHAGIAMFGLHGDPAFVAPLAPLPIRPTGEVGPIEVSFHPRASGEMSATLSLKAQWEDGSVEQQDVAISARARAIDEVPSSDAQAPNKNTAVEAQAASVLAPSEPLTEAQMLASDGLANAAVSATTVFDMRLAAIDGVASSQSDFVEKHNDPSIWIDLAEFALGVATAGIGKFVEEAVVTQVAGVIEGQSVRGLGMAVHEGAKAVEKEAPIEAQVVGTMVADGLSHAVERAPEAIEAAESKPGDNEVPAQQSQSNFFESQKVALAKARRSITKSIVGMGPQLRAMAKRDVNAAVSAASAITTALDQTAAVASDLQHRATASQLAAYKARVSLGREEVSTPHGTEIATNLEGTRMYRDGGFRAPRTGEGLLNIEVEIDADSVRVVGADVEGIAQEVANYLLGVDLEASHMPIRIVTNGHGFITCDELGRIRTNDFTQPFDNDGSISDHEPQRISGAERVARKVLSKSLRSWGLRTVRTNDGGKPHKGEQ